MFSHARPLEGSADSEQPYDTSREADDDATAAESAAMGPRMKRHPPGTWTIWSNAWFYITKAPGYGDVKCWVRSPLRNMEVGMGTSALSKTLVPRSLVRNKFHFLFGFSSCSWAYHTVA